MLKEIYLSDQCCDLLEIPYSGPRKSLRVCPGVLFGLRHDWDKPHLNTLTAFIMAESKLALTPVLNRPGWFEVTNPPPARHYVTVDVEPTLLREQRNLLLGICDNLVPAEDATVMLSLIHI